MLARFVHQYPHVTSRYLTSLVGFEEHVDRVVATVRNARTGEEEAIEAEYLVGCDGGSSAVLVEFPLKAVPMAAGDELYRLRCSGVTPVLAHPERYYGCTVDSVESWRLAGAVIQMDTGGLLGKGTISKLSRALVEEGLVDLFSSDNHGDSRTLATARDWLRDVSTPEHAELLTHINARRLLDGEPLLPVPPLPLASGIFSRLRELFITRR